MTNVKFLNPNKMSASARKRLKKYIESRNKRKPGRRPRLYITKADISGPIIEENATESDNATKSNNATFKKNSNTKKNTYTRSSGNNSETKMRNTNLNLQYQNWEAIQKFYNLPDPVPPNAPKPNIDTEPKLPPGLGVEPEYQNVDVLERYKGKSKKVSKRPGLSTIKESSNEPPPIPRNRPPRKASSMVTRKRPSVQLKRPSVPSKRPSYPRKPLRKAPTPSTSRSTQGSPSKIPRRRKVNSKSRISAFKGKGKRSKKKKVQKKKLFRKM